VTPSVRLDEADLVHVAAVASGITPERVLAGCDVAGLAAVAAALESATGGLDGAALVVLEVGRRRPFAAGNVATAWLAAAHLLVGDGLRLRIGALAAARVFEGSAELAIGEVVEVIEAHTEPQRGFVGRILRGLSRPVGPSGPGVHWCPACGRPLVQRRHDLVAEGVWVEAARLERVARCAVERGQHDRLGVPRRREVREVVGV
jgi:hypothetical protein